MHLYTYATVSYMGWESGNVNFGKVGCVVPNRVVSEDMLTSEEVNALSLGAEVFFRRLLSIVDDFGRFDGRPTMLRAWLYPFRLDDTPLEQIADWVAECTAVGLLDAYEVEGKQYIAVRDVQGGRAKTSKYPAPPNGPKATAWKDYRSHALVYFILDHPAMAVKIGSALCAESRLRELQTANPNQLSLLGTLPGGQPFEKELHRRFESCRIRGEWFAVKSELWAFLKEQGWVGASDGS